MRQEKSSLLRNKGFQSLLASLLCIVLGLLIAYIVLLIINPAGAGGHPPLAKTSCTIPAPRPGCGILGN